MVVARLCKQSQGLEEACAKALEQVCAPCGWSRMSSGGERAGWGRDRMKQVGQGLVGHREDLGFYSEGGECPRGW